MATHIKPASKIGQEHTVTQVNNLGFERTKRTGFISITEPDEFNCERSISYSRCQKSRVALLCDTKHFADSNLFCR
jgi:hypothetical protein